MVEKKSKVKEMSAEEATKKMVQMVEEQEVSQEQREKTRLIEELEAAEKAGKKVLVEEGVVEEKTEAQIALDNWVPKTELGRQVKAGKIKNIDEILDSGRKILEAQITDSLLTVNTELLNIGQAKGKFGGGKRRSWRQTQKKTMEGNVLTFSVMAIVGDGNGHVGIGFGRAAETLPAKEKAIRDAKLNIMKVKRGCASYDCLCSELHSIPMVTSGKCSSVNLTFSPAPQGAGLVVGDEIKKILRLAGIRDVYGKSKGKTRTTINVAKATIEALKNLNKLKE
ncbi:30S ribosomal protein S5 [uncultured archaeon]|nr:30S ribosomal protein S5 [uncultured archaeon]